MRTLDRLFTLCALATSVSARLAHVYLPSESPQDDPHSGDSKKQPLPLTPSAARLVLSHRLGVSDFHSLEGVDESTLEALDTFGGRWSGLFEDVNDRRPRAVVVIENVKDADDLTSSKAKTRRRPAFTVQDPPSQAQNKILFHDLLNQNEHLRGGQDEDAYLPLKINAGHDDHSSLQNCEVKAGCGLSIFHCQSRDLHHHHTDLTRKTLDNIHDQAHANDVDLITILMPPEPKTGLFRRSTTSSWGAYDQAPDAASSPRLERREKKLEGAEANPAVKKLAQDIEDSAGSRTTPSPERPHQQDADADDEERSTDTNAKKKTKKPKSSSHKGDHSTSGDSTATSSISESASSASATASSTPGKGGKGKGKKKPKPSNTSPPAGILPACYSSASACESTTHFCSGRGKCLKKYGGGSSSKESRAEGGGGGDVCYSCVCEAQKEKSKDGESTTYWGGPACQKKDVSVEFWLLGGFTVVLVGIVSWGIGLLYEMGAQELPSVLGAGVAGPRPK